MNSSESRMESRALVELNGVSKKYCRNLKRSLVYGCRDIFNEITFSSVNKSILRKDEFWCLSDISMKVHRGEALAIIGHNGAGKTTLLKLINGLIKPDIGEIRVRGKVGALIALGAGFNPILSGRENIYVNAAILGIGRNVIHRKIDEIIDFSELEEFIDSPVKNYSSGMRVRLGFAIAAQFKPDILLLDEVLAVGDISFRRKCINKLEEIKGDVALLFVSHNLRLVEQLCDNAIYIEKGKIKYVGHVDLVNGKYLEDINKKVASHDVFKSREGTGEVRFTSIRVFGEESGDNKLAHTGEDLVIEAEYEVFKAVTNIRFRVGIEDNKSGVMITAANCMADTILDNGKLVCIFNNIVLRPGNYSIILGVTDMKFALDIWKYAAEIIVTGGKSDSVQFSITDSDLVLLPHEIQVQSMSDKFSFKYS